MIIPMVYLSDFRRWITKVPFIRQIYIAREIARVNRVFGLRDFRVTKKINKVYVEFFEGTNFSARKKVVLEYMPKKGLWLVSFKKFSVYSMSNPLFEVVGELRGYTLLDNIHKGDHIIDVGASDGFITSFFAKSTGRSGLVVAIEPDLQILDIFKRTIDSNRLKNVEVVDKFLVSDAKLMNSLKQTSTPQLMENDNLGRQLNFVKLDIEGGELEILPDLINIILRSPECVVAIASYHLVDGKPSFYDIRKICKKYRQIYSKTVYTTHATTYLVNKKNSVIRSRLVKLNSVME